MNFLRTAHIYRSIMSASLPSIFPLECVAHTYAWGRPATSSTVYAMASASGATLDTKSPYAELWMGTHPSGPSSAVLSEHAKVPLATLLSNHASFYLGNRTLQTFGPTLPFLFKVLSVEKALSIQAHPSKDLASQLHISKPDLYKDGNHKPEIALPITRFEALCGFRSTTQVAEFVKRVPELAACANHVSTGAPFDLRRGFENLMRQSEEIISKNVAHLVQRLQNQDPATRSAEDELVLRLHAQYGNDVGVLCVYFLNFVTVEPGTFIYCAPNEPHAYLSGECVECMACSDNVVRAGLTPKPKDVDTLLRMLTYRDDLCGELISTGKKVSEGIELYDPPVPEFKVLSVKLGSSGPRKIVLDGPAIVAALMDVSGGDMVVTASEPALNEKQALAKGGVYFVRSGVELTFAPGQGHVYVATC